MRQQMIIRLKGRFSALADLRCMLKEEKGEICRKRYIIGAEISARVQSKELTNEASFLCCGHKKFMSTLKYLKNYLFGTWDRIYCFISASLNLIAICLTIFLWKFPEKIPWLIILRDLIIVFGLLLISGILLFKYIRRESRLKELINQLEESNKNLYKQFQRFHSIVHKFRNTIFKHFQKITPQDIQDIIISPEEKKTFENICHSITTEVKDIFLEYFQSKQIDIGKDVAITIKLAMTSQNIMNLYQEKLNDDEIRRIQEDKDHYWVVTVYRDPDTFEEYKEIREVGTKIYDIEKNTAFIHILREKRNFFASDNLRGLGDAYMNENDEWREYYNSTIVGPIRYYGENLGFYRYFGLIAADSLNENDESLYDNEESGHIIGHAADLLANYFLSIALHRDRKKYNE